MNYDNVAPFIALAIFGLGGLWKAATLRGQAHDEWRERVSDTQRQLTDRAVRELQGLQADVVQLASDDQSLPGLATFDPALVAERARTFTRVLAARARVQRNFKLLLRLGTPLIAASSTFLLGTASLFVHSSELIEGAVPRVGGITLMVAGGIVALVCVALYVVASQRLSGAEVLAFQTPQPGGREDHERTS